MASYLFWNKTLSKCCPLCEDLTPEMWKEFERLVATALASSSVVNQAQVDDFLKRFSSGTDVITDADRAKAMSIVVAVLSRHGQSTRTSVFAALKKSVAYLAQHWKSGLFYGSILILGAVLYRLIGAVLHVDIQPEFTPVEPEREKSGHSGADVWQAVPPLPEELAQEVRRDIERLATGGLHAIAPGGDGEPKLGIKEAHKLFNDIMAKLPKTPDGKVALSSLQEYLHTPISDWTLGKHEVDVDVVVRLPDYLPEIKAEAAAGPERSKIYFSLYNNDGTLRHTFEVPVAAKDYEFGFVQRTFNVDVTGLARMDIRAVPDDPVHPVDPRIPKVMPDARLLWPTELSRDSRGTFSTVITAHGGTGSIRVKEVWVTPRYMK